MVYFVSRRLQPIVLQVDLVPKVFDLLTWLGHGFFPIYLDAQHRQQFDQLNCLMGDLLFRFPQEKDVVHSPGVCPTLGCQPTPDRLGQFVGPPWAHRPIKGHTNHLVCPLSDFYSHPSLHFSVEHQVMEPTLQIDHQRKLE